MITRILEELIGKGIATSGTFTFGGSGVSTIEVPNNQVLIIHHFDYWHFCDFENDLPCINATSLALITPIDVPCHLQWQFNGGPVFVTVLDPFDVPQSASDFQDALDLNYPGFLITSMIWTPAPGTWTWTIVAPCPSAQYNGFAPNMTVLDPPIGTILTVGVTPFTGGIDATASIDAIKKASEHIIEFRSKDSRNHYAIRENVEIVDFRAVGNKDALFYVNVWGYYSKDCYMPHLENVQVDIWKIPQPPTWSIIFTNLPDVSNEARKPVGYGMGAAGASAVRQIIFEPLLYPAEKYLPLTTERDDLPIVDVHEQFRPDMQTNRQLTPPTSASAVFTNGRRYPLVNVDYILISAKNYSQYFKGSL